jgi:hypothetical protein
MTHLTLPRFWDDYHSLPEHVLRLADKIYELLKPDPNHPSLHLKKVGRTRQFWSVRVGKHYRALGVEKPDGSLWFWIAVMRTTIHYSAESR